MEPVTHRDPAAGETMIVHPLVPDEPLRVELRVAAAGHRARPRTSTGPRPSGSRWWRALAVRVGRGWDTLQEGESAVAPPGSLHAYRGVPGTAARVIVELEPPGAMAEFFAAFYTAPRSRGGAPGLRAMAPILHRHAADIAIPGLPRALLRLLSR
jgi:hypothetical protein